MNPTSTEPQTISDSAILSIALTTFIVGAVLGVLLASTFRAKPTLDYLTASKLGDRFIEAATITACINNGYRWKFNSCDYEKVSP